MATTVIKTVKPGGGGDYASLSAWEAGENGNLVAADEVRVAECYGGLDTSPLTIAGGTVDATRYLIVRAATGAEAQMPYGTSGVAYRLEATGNPGAIYHQQDYTQVRHIQIKVPTDDNAQRAIHIAPAGFTGTLTFGCHIIQATPTTFGTQRHAIYFGVDQTGPHYAVNNVIQWDSRNGATDVAAIQIQNITGGGVHVCFNNTVICAGVCSAAIGIQDVHNIVYIFNNLANGFPGGGFSGVNTGAYYNNAADDTSTSSHNASRASQTFTFVNAGAGDYHLSPSDAGAKGYGADLSADGNFAVTTDFDGQSRVGVPAFDIGADQISFAAMVGTDLAHQPWFQSLISQ